MVGDVCCADGNYHQQVTGAEGKARSIASISTSVGMVAGSLANLTYGGAGMPAGAVEGSTTTGDKSFATSPTPVAPPSRRLRENLKPGGIFVLEMVSKERLARSFQATTSRELPNGDLLFERHEIVDDWTRVRNRWTLMRAGSMRTFEFTNRIYSGQEMKALLASAGLAGPRLYGDLDGSSYGFDAQRLIAI